MVIVVLRSVGHPVSQYRRIANHDALVSRHRESWHYVVLGASESFSSTVRPVWMPLLFLVALIPSEGVDERV